MWIEALQSAKDLFPRALTSNDLATSEDIVVSTEKLRSRLSQEGISDTIINDCESIVLSEVSYLQGKLKFLQQKHIMLLDTLKQLEVLNQQTLLMLWNIHGFLLSFHPILLGYMLCEILISQDIGFVLKFFDADRENRVGNDCSR